MKHYSDSKRAHWDPKRSLEVEEAYDLTPAPECPQGYAHEGVGNGIEAVWYDWPVEGDLVMRVTWREDGEMLASFRKRG